LRSIGTSAAATMMRRCWFSTEALDSISSDAARWFPSETGGILMGYWAHTTEVVITACSVAGPLAQHSGSSYVPDAEYDLQVVASLYERSGRLHTYLGDWHSHPRHGAYLSTRDIDTLHGISRDANARAPVPLMLILAGGPRQWRTGIWCYRRFWGSKRALPMNIRHF
jgi:integrative and conjugative element protein (TIGR02256 family)